MGNPRLPHAVKFLMADFAEFFGTSYGHQIQNLASAHSWPLVWTLGSGAVSGDYREDPKYPGNERVLDPTLAKLLHVSLPSNSSSLFQAAWNEVKNEREFEFGQLSNVQKYWDQLKASQIRVAPVSPFLCKDVDRCIGSTIPKGECVCQR